jgi:hypothetical protein
MVRSPIAVLFAVSFAALALAPQVAHADDADALIKQGVERRRAHDDQGALELFRRAYDLAATPRALAQIGLAEQALGRWGDAETHLSAALERAADPWIAKYQSTLEASRADVGKHLGSLDVRGGPNGAEVRVDARFVGTLPLRRTLRVPAGTILLDVSASGFVSQTRTVKIEAGQLAHEELALQSRSATTNAAPAAAPTGAANASDATNATNATTTDAAASAPPAPTRRRWAQVALWSGLGLAAVGGGALVVGELEVRSYNDHGCAATPLLTACQDRHDTATRARVVGAVGLVGAGVLGATAAVLFLTSPKSASDGGETRAALACAPVLAPGTTAAACALRF